MTGMNEVTSPAAPSPLTRPYWEAAQEERLIMQRCTACGRPQLYPGYLCRNCRSYDLEWVDAAGTGTIYTFTRQHRAVPGRAAADTIIAIIELDEGPRLMSNIVDADVDSVVIGARVGVRFAEAMGVKVPVFALA